jgi:serine/threonine protein kinase
VDVGNYTLLHLLGRGGTSEVYAAKHRERGHSVAIKLVQTAAGVDLAAEAMRVRDIQHPSIVRMLEVGSDATSCYLVMELIEGETLAARLGRGPIAEPALRDLGAAIADGMQAAHARGIVHRDLKPGNVMLRHAMPSAATRGAADVPVIVDFGIAKSLGATSAAVTERRVGTVAYMAPEQLVDGLITPAVDIWALGVTLYEAATGELPFNSFVDGRLPQLFEPAPRLTTMSPAFADLVARCLDRDPGKRPASMAEIARLLRAADGDRVTADIGSTTASSRPAAPPRRGRRRDGEMASPPASRRVGRRWPLFVVAVGRRWPLIVVAVAGVAVAGVAAIVATRESSRPAPATMSSETTPPIATPPIATPPVVEAPPVVESPSTKSPSTKSPSTKSPSTQSPSTKSTTKRAKTRPKKRTTSQGETLD